MFALIIKRKLDFLMLDFFHCCAGEIAVHIQSERKTGENETQFHCLWLLFFFSAGVAVSLLI